MKLRHLFLFLSFYFFQGLLPAQAQVAGYLGKRLIAGYQFGMATNLSYDGPYLNLKHAVHSDYITGRKTMIGGEMTFMSMHFPFSDIHTVWEFPETYDLKVSFVQIGAAFTFFGIGSDALAPLGDYFQIKLMRTFATGSDPVGKSRNPKYLEQIPYEFSSNLIGGGLVYGHSKMIQDRVLLTASVDFNLLFPYIPLGAENEKSHTTLGYLSSTMIFYKNMFSLRLGVAGLLF